MRMLWALTKRDIKNVLRDPMLLLSLIGPLFLAAAMRFLLPLGAALLQQQSGFDLSAHYLFMVSFLTLFTPMMIGTLVGLIILDERDDNMLQYYAVTPLSKSGYLAHRLVSPAILSFLVTFPVLALAGLVRLNYAAVIAVVLMASLQAPFTALILGSFAGNKIEGLTLAKGLGLLYGAPLAGYLINSLWHLPAGIFPTYWVTQAFLASGGWYWFYLLGGFAVHAAALAALLRIFNRRAS